MDDFAWEEIARRATADLEKIKTSPRQAQQARLRQVAEAAGRAAEDKPLSFDISHLLEVMRKHEASDLHIKEGAPPVVRINGELFTVGKNKLSARECRELIFGACSRNQQELLDRGSTIDFAYSHAGFRYRINAYTQKSTFSASIRMIKDKIPSFKDLKLPESLGSLLDHTHGLILVTGPAGSGKSTTLASMIDYINERKRLHIITLEDPIEYVHPHKKSIITQREVGTDTVSFQAALKYSLRQDPNVILVGEMRDPETMMVAAQAAETGHLILSTLHTPNAAGSISRMIDIFQGENQKQMRLLLASNLLGVVSQRLIPRTDRKGRVPAVEVMAVTSTIASLILEGNISEIEKFIEDGTTEGMQTLNQSLYQLVQEKFITADDALTYTDNPVDMRMKLEGHTKGTTITDNAGDGLMSWM